MKYQFTEAQLEAMSKHKWMSDREKKVFDLFYRRKWDIERIADHLKLSRTSINKVLADIRKKTKTEQNMQ